MRRVVLGAALAVAAIGAGPGQAFALTWQDAAAGAGAKLSPTFSSRVQFVRPDGLMGVMVRTSSRSAITSAGLVAKVTSMHRYEALTGFDALVTPVQLRSLLASPAVRYVEPDHKVAWSLATSAIDVRARDAVWSFGGTGLGALSSQVTGLGTAAATGAGATSAILDSGIDGTHHDFSAFDCAPSAPMSECNSRIKAKWAVTPFISGLAADVGTLPTDDFASGHGTHVAGIVAGNGYYAREQDEGVPESNPSTYGGDGVPIGIAPQASLVSVKTGDTESAAALVEAIDFVAAHASEYGIRTANASAGCTGGCAFDPAGVEADAQKALYDAGVVGAFAAGNDAGGPDGASFSGDSQSPYVLSVAAYDHHTGLLADFSSRGSSASTLPDPATWDPATEAAGGQRRPDLAAPGVNIYSARNLTGGSAALVPRVDPNDNWLVGVTIPYASMSGTSMATPHVTGAATLLFSACPGARALDVMRALLVSARADHVRTTDGSRLAQPWEDGYGALDVRGALDWLRTNVAACA